MKLLLCIVVLCSLGWVSDALTCPYYWNTFNGYCYRAVSSIRTWHQAQAYCKALRGELVKITTAEENNFVLALAKQKAPHAKVIWIGLKWDSHIRKFVWSDDSVPVYQNWAVGEPNGNAREPCSNMWTGYAGRINHASGTWNDRPCRVIHNTARSFVCKRVP